MLRHFVLGNFVRFINLHASPKNVTSLNSNCHSSEETIELFLHGGTVFNRGVVILNKNDEGIKQLGK